MIERPMRIVYVYNSLALWGGVERIFIDKMNYLADVCGDEVYMLTYNQGDHEVPFVLSHRVHYEDLGVCTHYQYRYHGLRRYWERIVRQRRLRRLLVDRLAKIAPDIIVTTTAGLLSLLLDIKGKAALVIESHSDFSHVVEVPRMTGMRRLEQQHRYYLMGKVDVLVALTTADAERWRRVAHRVEVIPNIVHLNDTGCYSEQTQQRIIFVGRFAKQKGIPDLLAAWRMVHERYPDWQLDIYGEGEHKEELLAAVSELNANIEIHNPTHSILEKYRQSAMLVLTSLYEPFGLVIPEAMSCGLPVVSFEGDGPCSIITDGKDGFLVKDRNIHAFANRICQLIANRELRLQMGQAAVQSAQHYSADRIMPQWKQLFESLVVS